MELADYFPFWALLTGSQKEALLRAAVSRSVKKGTVLHNGSADCLGLLAVRSGQLRAYILSSEGREVTIYRLFERDACLFSASCMMRNIQFDVTIEAEKDSEVWIIPSEVYRALMDASVAVANYTNDLMSSRFSEIMWLMEQIMWRRFDQRLAEFLLQESVLEGSSRLPITHEKIANHLGTAREVVTRMLRYFQNEGMVKLTRGAVEITDAAKLTQLLTQ